MSPKELSYIDDALGHESFLKTQCQEAARNLQDPELSAFSRQIEEKHKHQALNSSLEMQDELYKKMSSKGWYNMEQADSMQIQKVKNQYSGMA